MVKKLIIIVAAVLLLFAYITTAAAAGLNVMATNITDNTVHITWTTSESVTTGVYSEATTTEPTYQICLNGAALGNTTATEYSITGLNPGVSYFISVKGSTQEGGINITTQNPILAVGPESIIQKGFDYITQVGPYIALVIAIGLLPGIINAVKSSVKFGGVQ